MAPAPDPLLRWIVIVPALGVLLNLVATRRARVGLVRVVGPGVVAASLAVAAVAAWRLAGLAPGAVLEDRLYTWISAGELSVDVTFRLDALSALMALVVTGVGFVIHLYSVGYMKGEEGFARYFAYLNLFTTSMLLLVLAGNLPLLFVGWEGVGLCSYLLIGFWYEKTENALAGNKAFIVNRIGDAGFLLGLFLLFWSLGARGVWSFDIAVIGREAPALLGTGTLTAVCLLLFTGATGKSAQIPLYVWLPDAMAGPTPVSALIHAATMVTAGVYMIARLHLLFAAAPVALLVVAVVGTATAILAAVIALAQTDLKKVLAYSTISQLGYMFLGLGVGAWGAAIFHLFTHAFFKALLFLGAGSVIHGLGGEQDVRRMGGLSTRMPLTFLTFAAGCLAISGFPPYLVSGFFSKDEILAAAFSGPLAHPWLGMVGLAGAGLTALYIFRLLFLTFLGHSRTPEAVRRHVHESPAVMLLPMVVLALFSIGAGWIDVPGVLAPVLGPGGHAAPHGPGGVLAVVVMAVSVGAAALGIALAYLGYLARPDLPGRVATAAGGLYRLVRDKFRVDEAYGWLVVRPLVAVSRWLAVVFDQQGVDAVANGTGLFAIVQGGLWRRLQTGNVQHYAIGIVLGALVVVGYYLTVAG